LIDNHYCAYVKRLFKFISKKFEGGVKMTQVVLIKGDGHDVTCLDSSIWHQSWRSTSTRRRSSLTYCHVYFTTNSRKTW